MLTLKKTVLSCFLAGCFLTTNAFAQDKSSFGVGVRPSNAEFIFEPGKSIRHTISVQNVSNIKPVKLVVSAVDWDLDENNKLVLLEPEKATDSAVSWVQFRPNTMTLTPTQGQNVIVDINVPVNAEPKEYRAAILFSTVLPSEQERLKHKGVWNRWQVASLMYFSPKIKETQKPIVKKFEAKAVKDFAFRGNKLQGSFDLSNQELYHLRLNIETQVFNEKKEVVAKSSNSMVLLPKRQLQDFDYTLTLDKDIDVGNYTLEHKFINVFSPAYVNNEAEVLKTIEQKISPSAFFGKKASDDKK